MIQRKLGTVPDEDLLRAAKAAAEAEEIALNLLFERPLRIFWNMGIYAPEGGWSPLARGRSPLAASWSTRS